MSKQQNQELSVQLGTLSHSENDLTEANMRLREALDRAREELRMSRTETERSQHDTERYIYRQFFFPSILYISTFIDDCLSGCWRTVE